MAGASCSRGTSSGVSAGPRSMARPRGPKAAGCGTGLKARPNDADGWQFENHQWREHLLEPDQHGRLVGRNPMDIDLDVLKSAGHAAPSSSNNIGWPGVGFVETVGRILSPASYLGLPQLTAGLGWRMRWL
jgi:hypothetical protein